LRVLKECNRDGNDTDKQSNLESLIHPHRLLRASAVWGFTAPVQSRQLFQFRSQLTLRQGS
jgi:hypothetical protein